MTKQKIPKIRFKEFDNEWGKKKLSDIAKMYQPVTISQSDLVLVEYLYLARMAILGIIINQITK
ncbi:hypothetical protein [Streptococcus sobrinus]|uniref:hypothetical protein n=1 Tax=Streptococcus sobrinus TaxID=1310 RepID=UPI0002BE67F0|nr:hypothetical protein [Streptococcus sobrinus]EMP69718.1 type I restriction modification DNA specificity domain protein [Streptococcus sobrinus DSM 20742 = ATCC 33478]SQG12790.1 Uncharacterised protein [Streptococcus sobrinus]